MTPRTLNNQDGIALGPILFIIAILAIFAAAIAAGSGSFTASTNTENAKIQASTLIQIGDTLRNGTDNLVSNGVNPSAITYGTTLSTDLFSPNGGGIMPPSATFLVVAQQGFPPQWWYLYGTAVGWGTSNLSLFAFGQVASQAVCDQINKQANGISTPSIWAPFFAWGGAANQFDSPVNFGTLTG